MAKQTLKQRHLEFLKAKGWIEDPKARSSKYLTLCKPGVDYKYFLGNAGAVRRGTNVSNSFSVKLKLDDKPAPKQMSREELGIPMPSATKTGAEQRSDPTLAVPATTAKEAGAPVTASSKPPSAPKHPVPKPQAKSQPSTPSTSSTTARPVPATPTNTTHSLTPTSSPAAAAAPPATPLGKLLSKAVERVLVHDNAPHLIVEARAGTGKTTTLVEGLKHMRGLPVSIQPSPQQAAVWAQMLLSRTAQTICFCAFNKAIATELQARVPAGCDAMTMHSLGYRAVTKALGRQEPSGYVVQDIIADLTGIDIRQLRKEKPALLKGTDDLVSLCKMNLTDLTGVDYDVQGWQEARLSELVAHYDIELNGSRGEVFQLVPQVLERCKTPKGKITFDDMIWLPVIHKLPLTKYDLLLVDECLPGWTPIMLADGQSKTIKEIVESPKMVRVRAYDTSTGESKNCWVIGKHKILNQKPLVKVKVKHLHRTGTNRKCNIVVCTVDHKIWTVNRGWVQAGDLKLGDDVVVETAAKTTQRGKITTKGRGKLAELQIGNQRGLGNKGGDPSMFNSIKGGNGRGQTLAEQTLLDALGFGWEWQFIVKTGDAPQFGRGDKPSHYKLDIAEPNLKIAVEVDGQSHRHLAEIDCKKQNFLESEGWKVVRVSNRNAIQKTSSVVAELISLAESIGHRNCPRPARVVSVDFIEIPDSYVYDITVEECHNFYANGILVHNCQDLNRCQQALAKMAGKRLILVGDPRQAIYGFAGADAESMPRMARELGHEQCPHCFGSKKIESPTFTEECPHCKGNGQLDNGIPGQRGCTILPLTVTRRCGHAIVKEACKIVSDFEAHEDNCEGKVSRMLFPFDKDRAIRPNPEKHYAPSDGDMVVCRCNAPLVSECFRFLKAGRKAQIQGRDIGQGLISTIKKLCNKREPVGVSIAEMISLLDDWLHGELAKEQAKRMPNDTRLQSLQDRHDCLSCFAHADNVKGADDLIRKIESVFTDDKKSPGIKLSSIHKAKGLESRRVFILQLDKASVPAPWAKLEWERDQEQNLFYVAITRAIEELCYVS